MSIQECTEQLIDSSHALQWEVDKRRQAEQALLESEEMNRRLFEAAPSGIVILGQDGNIATVNPNMTRMSGYTLEELQFLGLNALYSSLQLCQELLGVLSGSSNVQSREVRLKRKDGTLYDALLNADMWSTTT